MKQLAFKYFKYFLLSVFLLTAIFFLFAFYFNQSIKYGFDQSIPSQLDREGPYIALIGDSIAEIHYILGDRKEGFELQSQKVNRDTGLQLPVYYPPDKSEFNVPVDFQIQNEQVNYPEVNKIFAVSDMEGNFNTFRSILRSNQIVDDSFIWAFGDGHLVLLGDYVDKGYFVTQSLWFIYKLEREAEKAGGKVHYILGNHEINNLQGYFRSTPQKYWYTANILGLKRNEFYGAGSYLGQWLASKNVVEKIGSFIFVHGGLHPDFAKHDLDLRQINEQIKKRYRTPYFNKKGEESLYHLLYSTKKSPSWYRGYFNEKLPQEEIDLLLKKYDATKIIAGHTTLPKVSYHYDKKIIGIDVKNPLDHLNYFPERRAEALLFENGKWFRVNDNGIKRML